MTFDHFVGQVQHRAQLASTGEALRAIRCTFETLAERLDFGEAKDLAAQLPRELATYFAVPEHSVRMSLNDFFKRVSEREQVVLPKSIHHARAVIEVLQEAVSAGEIDDVQAQLPQEWGALFASGSQGRLQQPKQSISGQGEHMKVKDILTHEPEVIHPDAMICEAARMMQEHDIGMLPVCDGDRLVGAVTDRDLVIRAVAKGYDPLNTPVRDMMTPGIRYCFEEDDVQTAAQIMEDRQVRRLPVINAAKRLVGILSVGDLAVRTHNERLVEEVMEAVCEPA